MLSGPDDVNTVKTHKSSNYVICQRSYRKRMVQWQWFPNPKEFYALTACYLAWLLPHGFVNARFVSVEGLQVCARVFVNQKKKTK